MHNKEQNLIIEFDWSIKNDGPFNFKIYGDELSIDLEEGPDISNLFVLMNDKPQDEFGETFTGYKLDSFDLLYKVISSYVNEETEMYFFYVCDELKAFKDAFMKENQGLGKAKYSDREIYLYILNSNLDKLECDACYSANGVEYGAYIGENEIVAIVDTSDGSLVTDYESFYIDHITGLVEQPSYRLEFHSENFKEVMSDYDIDVDVLTKNCSEVKKIKMQKIYSNDDIQDMITAVNDDQKLKEKVLGHFSGNDLHAIQDVLNDGWYERFDRYDSDVCEQFIIAYEAEV